MHLALGRVVSGVRRPGPEGGIVKALRRTTLVTSRLLDFFTRKELVAQSGHEPHAWPLVVLKELLDNSADATEDAGIAPEISVRVDNKGIAVMDNGPGISQETVAKILDFSVRVSSREGYVSPTRGAQGNALKTLLAMPFVLNNQKDGRVIIDACGVRHTIRVRVDRIRQEPVVQHDKEKGTIVKTGTSVHIEWPDSACSILQNRRRRFLQIADDYTFLNPHLSLTVDWFGEKSQVKASNPKWAKWLPSDFTCAHWYKAEHLERLAAGYIAQDIDRNHKERTVREFVAEFSGFTGSAKQKKVLEATGLARLGLSALRNGDGLDHQRVAQLLKTLKEHSKPIKPAALGVIGRDHLEERFAGLGANLETFEYKKITGFSDEDSLPFVVETAFAYCPDRGRRRLITGVNWAPGIVNPFRQLGRFGQSLDTVLEAQRSGRDEEVVMMMHLAYPRVEFTDRGKSAVVISGDYGTNDEEE
jgi:DNA topoisomerase VI subunit B